MEAQFFLPILLNIWYDVSLGSFPSVVPSKSSIATSSRNLEMLKLPTFSIAPFLACLLLHVFYNVWKSCLSICEHIVLLWFLKYHVSSVLFQVINFAFKVINMMIQTEIKLSPSTQVDFIYERNRTIFFLNQSNNSSHCGYHSHKLTSVGREEGVCLWLRGYWSLPTVLPTPPTHQQGTHPCQGCCPRARWAEPNNPAVINNLPPPSRRW